MAGLRSLADLLQPSLTEADDLIGFHRPWDPRHIWLAMVLCGTAGGGALLALNYRRLGMRSRATPVFALCLGLQVAVLALFGWLTARGEIALEDPYERQGMLFVGHLVAVMPAWPFLRAQLARFRIYERGDQPAASLLGPGIVAAVLNGTFMGTVIASLAPGGALDLRRW